VTGTAKDWYQGGYNFSQWGVEWIGTLKDNLTPTQYIYVKQICRKETNNN